MYANPDIVNVLTATKKAHRAANGDTNHADWANWYARYLLDETAFQSLTARDWSASDLAEALSNLEAAYAARQPKTTWAEYYAARLSQ